MADNNRNWGSRSTNQDWNEGRYEDRGNRDYSENRENYYNQGRYGEDFGDSYRGRRDYDYNRDYNQGNQGSAGTRQEDDRNYSQWNRGYGNRDYSQEDRSGIDFDRGYTGYGGGRNMGSDNWSSRMDRSGSTFSPGGYMNYGGGSGYGGNYWQGGFGGSNYGRRFGSGSIGESYGGNYGTSYGNPYSNYDRGMRGEGSRWDSDQNRGYGMYDRGYGQYGGEQRYRGPQSRERGWWDRTTDEISSWFGDEDAERRRRMDKMYRGRGPKNYKRSDDRIREDINDRLSDDWFIDASDIEVTVQNGEVTLTGKVDSREAKRRAEDIADQVSGVTNVENRIRVSKAYEESFGFGGSPSTAGTISGQSSTETSATTGGTGRRSTLVGEGEGKK